MDIWVLYYLLCERMIAESRLLIFITSTFFFDSFDTGDGLDELEDEYDFLHILSIYIYRNI